MESPEHEYPSDPNETDQVSQFDFFLVHVMLLFFSLILYYKSFPYYKILYVS